MDELEKVGTFWGERERERILTVEMGWTSGI